MGILEIIVLLTLVIVGLYLVGNLITKKAIYEREREKLIENSETAQKLIHKY